jgi:hypothetical protein
LLVLRIKQREQDIHVEQRSPLFVFPFDSRILEIGVFQQATNQLTGHRFAAALR